MPSSSHPVSNATDQRPRKGRWLIILLLPVVLLAILYFGYGQIRKHQSRRLEQLAQTYLQEGRMKEAQMSLQTALRLSPTDPVALRLQAHLAQSMGEGEGHGGLDEYQRRASENKLTLNDLRPVALLAEQQKHSKLADDLAETASGQSPFLGHIIRSDLLTMRNQPKAAAAELRQVINGSQELSGASKTSWANAKSAAVKDSAAGPNPTPKPQALTATQVEQGDVARMALVDLLMKQGAAIFPEDPAKGVAEALSEIRVLASRDNEAGAQALMMALQSGIVPASERSEWMKRLRAHPKVTPRLLLLADADAIRSNPADEPAVVSAMLERVRKGTPEDRLAAAQLLLVLREPARAAELCNHDEVFKSPASFLLWLQAKQMTGAHREILSALEDPSNPLPPLSRELYRAAELKADKQGDKSKEAFLKALSDHVLSRKKMTESTDVLIFLSAAGEQELFEQGLQVMLADPADAESSLNAIMAGVRRQRDSAKLLRIMELAATSPSLSGNVRVLNELAYERLVMNQPVALAQLTARREANPNEFSFRLTEALALLRAGNNAKALVVLESIETDVDAAKLPPPQLAVLAMTQAANENHELALSIFSLIPFDQLSREEMLMLQSKFASLMPRSPAVPLPTPDGKSDLKISPAVNKVP